jgi:putative flavoprotein involved in K+ transport
MPIEHIDTLVIGGGQAGLVMSHMLGKRGREHLVLERNRIGERWRSERWDGLRFQFPNWSVRLPDFPFPHSDPDAFATNAEIVDFLAAYAEFVAPPIRCGVAVTALRAGAGGSGFIAETPHGSIAAENIVVATGPYQRPLVPPLFPADATMFQVHASGYRAPEQLPPGAVLVVGSGASGAQIAEELALAGRRVYLAVGRHRRMPRRYRGRDFIWWLQALGLYDMTVETRGPPLPQPLITGACGGHTIDFREFAAHGVVLMGRAVALRDGVLEIAADLEQNLAAGDAALNAFLDLADRHVAEQNLDLPVEPAAREVTRDPACITEPIRRLDLQAAGITSAIWATGYAPGLDWMELPVLDAGGSPIHNHGISAVPGLYFIGLQWLAKMKSSFLSGVEEDAARLADHIAARG